jgi:uncharacterized RDD family membrane protein YckC
MTEQPPVSPPPPEPPEQPYQQAYQPPPAPPPAPAGGWTAAPPPAPGVPRPGELVDRFLARLIDGVGLGIVYGVLYAVLGGIFLTGFTHSTGEWLLFYLFFSVITTVISLGYYAYLESSQGATFGKQLLKLKVVGPDGASTPTLEQAIRRNVFLAFSLASIVPLVGSLIGGLATLVAVIVIAVGINSDPVARQGWHDKFAGGTRVLKVG